MPSPSPGGATGMSPRRSLAFFGHDRHDSAIKKRTTAFERHGWRVQGFMFHRDRPNLPPLPADAMRPRRHPRPRLRSPAGDPARRPAEDPRTCGGATVRRHHLCPQPRHAGIGHRAARRLTGSRAPVVYEALDVRRIIVGNGLVSRLFRAAERRLLAMSDALVVSSPDYMSRYFWPVQHFAGQWHLLENKLAGPPPAGDDPRRGGGPPPPKSGEPWIIGWFGVLKCRRSLDILTRIAQALGPRCVIHVRGIVSESEVPPALVAEIAARHPNIVFAGPYANPADLPAIYGQVHITWAADFLDPQSNSAGACRTASTKAVRTGRFCWRAETPRRARASSATGCA